MKNRPLGYEGQQSNGIHNIIYHPEFIIYLFSVFLFVSKCCFMKCVTPECISFRVSICCLFTFVLVSVLCLYMSFIWLFFFNNWWLVITYPWLMYIIEFYSTLPNTFIKTDHFLLLLLIYDLSLHIVFPL